MKIEQFGYPLMIAGAVAGIWVLLREKSTVAVDYPNRNGFDPGGWLGKGIAETPQYFARIPNYPMDPGYIASARGNPYQQDPSADVSIGAEVANGGGDPTYIDYNTYGLSTSPLLQPPASDHGSCGCGGCDAKCKGDCDTNVRFVDGRGACLAPETGIVESPSLPVGMWMGIQNLYSYPGMVQGAGADLYANASA